MRKTRFFTRQETIVVTLLFALVFFATYLNMRTSLRRARDAQRKGDLGAVTDALEKFKNELGFFPSSENGKIKICKADNFEDVLNEIKTSEKFDMKLFETGLKTCEWGNDPLRDVLDDSVSPYMKSLPSDPKTKNGINYYYMSNGERFQIYTYLEGEKTEDGYDERIISRNINCGIKICSFGRSYNVPVDKSIEQYELELLQKKSGQ